jgi:hypothetical protein
MKIVAFGCKFFKTSGNILDAFIVTSSCVDAYIFQPLEIRAVDLSILRLVRLTRILKLLKVVRSSPFFSELRVLIRTLAIAIRGIVWSIVLLTFIIIAGGILQAQFAISYLEDDTIPMETRVWLYKNFGTTMSAMHTMFECTFTGSWHRFSRPLVEDVSYIYAAFWVLWVVLINFTTMRVIGALFLKDTMAVSARDNENCAMNQLKNKVESTEMLRIIFHDADVSGDGQIDQGEFDAMMERVDVVDQFALLGLDADAVSAFFTVLSADDGAADYNEFITGALAMASSAPTLDRLKSMQAQIRINKNVHANTLYLQKLCEHMNVNTQEL